MFDDILGSDKNDFDEDFWDIDMEKYNNEPICPKCGSTSIRRNGQGFFVLGPKFMQPMKCIDCSCEWKELRNNTTKVVELI